MLNALSRVTIVAGIVVGIASSAMISSCSQGLQVHSRASLIGSVVPGSGPTLIDPTNDGAFSALVDDVSSKRVVFVGETHDRYDHHLNQLAVIRRLHQKGVDLAIGMEFFQEPFQPYLDQYASGEIGEKELLKKTEYYERWRYDYRLYRDMLAFARQNRIPLVALNAPTELVARVSRSGIEGLKSEERARLPEDLRAPDPAYLARLRPIFEMHGKASEEQFRRFADVQLLWDEHMARVARDYMIANPSKTMVILAGSGHIAYPDAIPGRLARMVPGEYAVVVTGPEARFPGGGIDFLLAERDVELPPPGRMGMMLASETGGVTVSGVQPSSPAAEAGFRPGDRVLSVAGETVRGMDDIRLALLDRAPGEQVLVEVARRGAARDGDRQGRVLTLM